MDYYTIEFRIYGAELRPERVSEDLQLRPTTIQLRGEARDSLRSFERSMWGYARTDDDGGLVRWSSLEEGLRDLLRDLTPIREKISKYHGFADLVFWCGLFQEAFGSGPSISPETLEEISQLKAAVNLSTYANHYQSLSTDR